MAEAQCTLFDLLLNSLLSSQIQLSTRNKMKISLRKASALQNRINETLREVLVTTRVEVSEFVDVEQTVDKAINTFNTNESRRNKLLIALYNIRSLVGTANVNSTIDMKLATAAYIDKRLAQLQELVNQPVMQSYAEIKGKVAKAAALAPEARRFSYDSEGVQVSIITAEHVAQFKKEIAALRKQKQKINDEILELNIKTEIELSDATVVLLQNEGIL